MILGFRGFLKDSEFTEFSQCWIKGKKKKA
jgi:hypothetical protein